MSCRVLSRGMEEFIFSEIIALAKKSNARIVRGKYIPSKKNKVVSSLYKRLGFKLANQEPDGTAFWELSMEEPLPTFSHTIQRAKEKTTAPESPR